MKPYVICPFENVSLGQVKVRPGQIFVHLNRFHKKYTKNRTWEFLGMFLSGIPVTNCLEDTIIQWQSRFTELDRKFSRIE